MSIKNLTDAELKAELKRREDEAAKREAAGGLEAEFAALVQQHAAEIYAKVKEAEKALNEATKLSDKHGIPFYANVSSLGQNYTPSSYFDKFKELDVEFAAELTDVYPDDYDRGWQHSQVC